MLVAEPGYTTTDQMPENIYKAHDMNDYIEFVDIFETACQCGHHHEHDHECHCGHGHCDCDDDCE